NISKFRAESGFYTWIYRITTNLSLNTLQKRRVKDFVKFDTIAASLEADTESPDDNIQKEQYRTIVENAIATLPAKQRAVFIMRYYDELSYEDMAKVLKKSVGGLKANYFHALKKVTAYLRKELNEL
ncbi:MAG TPA: RNA polymerase sigma factor, partial [Bacteroidota bacterium]|nr:RNA polymerase sigma factor [Bacteroidota bacterium]